MTRAGAATWSARGLVAIGLALIIPACAKGNTPETGSDDAPVVADGGAEGASSACSLCAADEVCSSGMCVAANTDADGDGFPAKQDCDDHDPAIHPGAAEVCNGKDDNCDGKIDEGFDKDNDGVPSCQVGTKPADCDDDDPTVHPGATEVCNGKDDNCDGKVDEGFDKDNDGFYACVRGTIAADCNDSDPTIHPGATEVCNGKDDDCDGNIDNIPALLHGSLTSPIDSHWTVNGSGFISSGLGMLNTNASTYETGALWWQGVYKFDVFDMSVTFTIENKTNGADGMGFAWVPGTNYVTVGGAGAGYGMGALGGYGVVIDTFQNTGEPVAPFLALVNNTLGTPTQLAKQNLPNVRDGLNHRLRVQLTTGGKVSVWVDAVNYIFEFPIPAYSPFFGHWGFTGGTGALTETHTVTDITMSFPNGQGCVP